MPHNRSLALKVANRKAFVIPGLLLFVAAMLSTILSPHAALLTLPVFLVFCGVLFAYILDFHKVNGVELVSVIFPDGRVRLEPTHQPEIEAYLDGQQWCTRHITVLRYKTGGIRQYLVLLSAQQDADEYRRLNVWLRQDFCNDTGNQPVSGI